MIGICLTAALGSEVYKSEVIKLVVKSFGASFLFGWFFAILIGPFKFLI